MGIVTTPTTQPTGALRGFEDFKGFDVVKYEDVPSLCEKFKIKKNLINPIYLS